MHSTTNYALQVPDQNDTVDIPDNAQTNLTIIDTQMYENAQAAATAQTAANSAQTAASNAQSTANEALSAAQNINIATETTAGIVKTSGTSGVAVTTDDAKYVNGAQTNVAQTFTAKQIFTAGVSMQESDVTIALGFTPANAATTPTEGANTFTGNQTAPAFVASGLTGATAGSRFVGGTTEGAPTSGTWSPADLVTDQSGNVFVYANSVSGSVSPVTQGGADTFTSGDSYFTPFQVNGNVTISAVSIELDTSGGSVETAIFSSSGSILSGTWSTSVAMSSGIVSIPLSEAVALTPGNTYYVGIYVNDNNTVSISTGSASLSAALGITITLGNATYYGSGQTFNDSNAWIGTDTLSVGFTFTVPAQWMNPTLNLHGETPYVKGVELATETAVNTTNPSMTLLATYTITAAKAARFLIVDYFVESTATGGSWSGYVGASGYLVVNGIKSQTIQPASSNGTGSITQTLYFDLVTPTSSYTIQMYGAAQDVGTPGGQMQVVDVYQSARVLLESGSY